MYNRYIPQPDGSYRKNRIQDSHKESEQPIGSVPVPVPVSTPDCSTLGSSCPHCPNNTQKKQGGRARPMPPVQNVSTISFLKQLLPKDFNAEDLLVVLLLLLMTGNSHDDQNSALLTLVLYLFL